MWKILKINARFVKKNAKIRDGKMLKPLNYHQKLRSNLSVKPKGDSGTPRADKNKNNAKNFQKAKKNSINLRF